LVLVLVLVLVDGLGCALRVWLRVALVLVEGLLVEGQ
jgi:hypothetical protein